MIPIPKAYSLGFWAVCVGIVTSKALTPAGFSAGTPKLLSASYTVSLRKGSSYSCLEANCAKVIAPEFDRGCSLFNTRQACDRDPMKETQASSHFEINTHTQTHTPVNSNRSWNP